MKRGIRYIAPVVFTGLALGAVSASAYQGDPSVQGPNCDGTRRAAIEEAINENDYEAWKSAMGTKGRVTEVITQDNFGKFVEMRKLMLEKRYEEAAAIRAELGLGTGKGSGMGMGHKGGRGMHGGTRGAGGGAGGR